MIDQNIKELSGKVLDNEDLKEINRIIDGVKNGDKESALKELAEVLGMRPKRPLYYIYYEIVHLPKYGARNIIRYSGDYIDQLVRFTLEDRRFLSRWFKSPLGHNVNKLKKYINPDFYNCLILFNKIYAQAKHEFNHHEDKSLFNFKDTAYMIFITKKISQKILLLSERAMHYDAENINFKVFDGKL